MCSFLMMFLVVVFFPEGMPNWARRQAHCVLQLEVVCSGKQSCRSEQVTCTILNVSKLVVFLLAYKEPGLIFANLFHAEYYCKGCKIKMHKKLPYLGKAQRYSF